MSQESIIKSFEDGHNVLVQGIRRSGKTELALQLAATYMTRTNFSQVIFSCMTHTMANRTRTRFFDKFSSFIMSGSYNGHAFQNMSQILFCSHGQLDAECAGKGQYLLIIDDCYGQNIAEYFKQASESYRITQALFISTFSFVTPYLSDNNPVMKIWNDPPKYRFVTDYLGDEKAKSPYKENDDMYEFRFYRRNLQQMWKSYCSRYFLENA